MRYYFASHCIDPKIVGITDGTTQANVYENGFIDKENYTTFFNIFADILVPFNIENALSADFVLEYVKLRSKAKITDFVSFSPRSYLLVNQRVKRIFESVSLLRSRFFKANLYYDNGNAVDESYWFCVCGIIDSNEIDFKRSEFTTWSSKDGFKPIIVNSLDEYFKLESKQLQRVVFTSPYRYDVFRCRLSAKLILSEKVVGQLSNIKAFGLEFKPIEIEFPNAQPLN